MIKSNQLLVNRLDWIGKSLQEGTLARPVLSMPGTSHIKLQVSEWLSVIKECNILSP